jgi:hypothetical protein
VRSNPQHNNTKEINSNSMMITLTWVLVNPLVIWIKLLTLCKTLKKRRSLRHPLETTQPRRKVASGLDFSQINYSRENLHKSQPCNSSRQAGLITELQSTRLHFKWVAKLATWYPRKQKSRIRTIASFAIKALVCLPLGIIADLAGAAAVETVPCKSKSVCLSAQVHPPITEFANIATSRLRTLK